MSLNDRQWSVQPFTDDDLDLGYTHVATTQKTVHNTKFNEGRS